eukprot:3630714-Rhodomonas_salina.1
MFPQSRNFLAEKCGGARNTIVGPAARSVLRIVPKKGETESVFFKGRRNTTIRSGPCCKPSNYWEAPGTRANLIIQICIGPYQPDDPLCPKSFHLFKQQRFGG